MLNPFPDLFTYSFFAPTILRLVAGLVFINLGRVLFKGEKNRWMISLNALGIPNPKVAVKVLGLVEIIGGVLLFVGFYTQIAALVLAVLTFAEAYVEYKDPTVLKRNFPFYLILLAITLSLLLSGAGAFAFDLPL